MPGGLEAAGLKQYCDTNVEVSAAVHKRTWCACFYSARSTVYSVLHYYNAKLLRSGCGHRRANSIAAVFSSRVPASRPQLCTVLLFSQASLVLQVGARQATTLALSTGMAAALRSVLSCRLLSSVPAHAQPF